MDRLPRRSVLKQMAGLAGLGLLGPGCVTSTKRDRPAVPSPSAASPSATSPPATSPPHRPPNFVVIFCDDLGYGDLGCYGNTEIRTPNLDRMALEGVRFTDFYAAAPVCSPSRAALMTGRYPIRSGFNRVLFPQSKTGLDDSEITIAQVLRARGYATGCVGKWHLGHLPPFLPTRHGFDSYFGLPYSNDMTSQVPGNPELPLMRNEEVIERAPDQNLLTRRYTEEAIGFIDANKDKPFFLYLAHSMPHVPIHASDAFRGKSKRGLYGDVIEEIDWSVGQILGALSRNSLDEDTLVVFTSDNGPWLVKKQDGGTAGPLREGKGTTFEGGMREPGIFRWPGHIAPGRLEASPAITMDLMPTFAALAGTHAPKDRPIDGKDISRLLLNGKSDGDRELFYFSQGALEAVRSGNWKLKRPFKGKVYGQDVSHPALLFDLKADPGEQHDLAAKHPKLVRRLEKRMRRFQHHLGRVPETKK